LEEKFPTGALALFECESDRWEELGADNARLQRFVTPRTLTGEDGD
jgi:phosphohistidine phosphatase